FWPSLLKDGRTTPRPTGRAQIRPPESASHTIQVSDDAETKRRLSGLKANVAAYGTVCLRVKEPRGCRHTTTCRPPINENLSNPEAIHSPSRLYANWVTQLKSPRYEPISFPVVASSRTISPSRPRASSRPSQLKAAHCAGLSKSSDAREAKSQ